MEESKVAEYFNYDQFFDALDEFPFFDCNSNAEWEEELVELPDVSTLESVGDRAHEVVIRDTNSEESCLPNGNHRRFSFQSGHEGVNGDDYKDLSSDWTVILENSQLCEGIVSGDGRNKNLRSLKDQEKEFERSDVTRFSLSSDNISGEKDPSQEVSCVTSTNRDPVEELDDDSSSFLVFLAGLVIKAVGFQASLLVSFFTFPIWFSYCSFVFLKDPFRTSKRVKERINKNLMRMWRAFCECFTPFLNEQLKGHRVIGKLAVKFGRGFLWSVYVCFVLFGFLVTGFIISALMMRFLVEEPILVKETLDFDYTKTSPVALVPIVSCSCVSYGASEVGKYVGSRGIPSDHKLQITILLTLPESEYNRKLGVFQVRVESLSANGEVTSSSSRPCMLKFKSHLIRYLETFLKSVPLLAGYSSESQVIKLKMKGFTEGYKPTFCIRVLLEQRAEYKSGAGIPEIYAASLVLESELSLFKRTLWYWKKTIFIWISIVSFIMELLLILACCRPILIPKARPRPDSNRPLQRDGSTNTNAP